MADNKRFKANKGVSTGDLHLTSNSGDDVGIVLSPSASAPATTTNKLYAKSGAGAGLYYNGSILAGGGSVPDEFTDLNDTPNSFSGQGNKIVAVNNAGNALEFIEDSSFINAVIFG